MEGQELLQARDREANLRAETHRLQVYRLTSYTWPCCFGTSLKVNCRISASTASYTVQFKSQFLQDLHTDVLVNNYYLFLVGGEQTDRTG